LNHFVDLCHTSEKQDYKSEKLKVQHKIACGEHFSKMLLCQNKHKKWFDARYDALVKAVPGIMEPRQDNLVHPDRDLNSYPKFDSKKI